MDKQRPSYSSPRPPNAPEPTNAHARTTRRSFMSCCWLAGERNAWRVVRERGSRAHTTDGLRAQTRLDAVRASPRARVRMLDPLSIAQCTHSPRSPRAAAPHTRAPACPPSFVCVRSRQLSVSCPTARLHASKYERECLFIVWRRCLELRTPKSFGCLFKRRLVQSKPPPPCRPRQKVASLEPRMTDDPFKCSCPFFA